MLSVYERVGEPAGYRYNGHGPATLESANHFSLYDYQRESKIVPRLGVVTEDTHLLIAGKSWLVGTVKRSLKLIRFYIHKYLALPMPSSMSAPGLIFPGRY